MFLLRKLVLYLARSDNFWHVSIVVEWLVLVDLDCSRISIVSPIGMNHWGVNPSIGYRDATALARPAVSNQSALSQRPSALRSSILFEFIEFQPLKIASWANAY